MLGAYDFQRKSTRTSKVTRFNNFHGRLVTSLHEGHYSKATEKKNKQANKLTNKIMNSGQLFSDL